VSTVVRQSNGSLISCVVSYAPTGIVYSVKRHRRNSTLKTLPYYSSSRSTMTATTLYRIRRHWLLPEERLPHKHNHQELRSREHRLLKLMPSLPRIVAALVATHTLSNQQGAHWNRRLLRGWRWLALVCEYSELRGAKGRMRIVIWQVALSC
jgi:hypothetical protein